MLMIVMMMIIVIASALGPAILAAGKTYFGSYTTILHSLAVLPVILFLGAAALRNETKT